MAKIPGVLRRVPLRLLLIVVVLATWGAAVLGDVRGIERTTAYSVATALLLAVGLFGSTAGIDRAEAAAHKSIILAAITIGVFVKAALIGGALFLATNDPVFFVLGVAVAQIDPLSVAAILGDDRLSAPAKSILASWASFDDPLTVILVIYTSAFVMGERTSIGSGLAGYAIDVLLNLALACAAFLAWHGLRRWPVVMVGVLAALLVVAVWQFLMLGVAIAGLFVRPAWLVRVLPTLTNAALLLAGGLLGLLLVAGIDLIHGAMLGVAAFGAQIVAALLLTRRLSPIDRLDLALAQQNGITAIILALRLEATYPGTVAIIAPSIVVTNLTHFVANHLADRVPWVRPHGRLDAAPGRAAGEEASGG